MLICYQFPMSEYVKDPAQPNGWKTISYDSAGKKKTTVVDGAPVTNEGMDEGCDDGGSDVDEGPDSALLLAKL